MKAVLQRVSQASVTVAGEVVGSIGHGLVILLGVEEGDSDKDSTYLAYKTAEMRIFADESGKMNKSIKEVEGSVLLISQFTLICDWKKGRRPGFTRAAQPEQAEQLYRNFSQQLNKQGIQVALGTFGANMEIALVNEGPVTLVLENQFGDDL